MNYRLWIDDVATDYTTLGDAIAAADDAGDGVVEWTTGATLNRLVCWEAGERVMRLEEEAA